MEPEITYEWKKRMIKNGVRPNEKAKMQGIFSFFSTMTRLMANMIMNINEFVVQFKARPDNKPAKKQFRRKILCGS
jgi:membrane-bound lytic murein transglycosylase